jgi:hypothetical protein
MKNYSQQFGDSKISDDVMIRAARPMGLTAAQRLAKRYDFYRLYPYFFGQQFAFLRRAPDWH